MVNLIDDWNVLEEYSGKLGFYQLTAVGGCFEVRVMLGRLGFRRQFSNDNDKLLNQILDFCKKRNFIRLGERIRDEDFFK
ncbi:MAG: hypothetical protein M1490_04895 [Candidatus Bathyarchaeota archaeon]|nr:hypothetical protein [Candidatus Bathyarchaeota archaeon]